MRHGESEWNAQGIYQGWLESGLTPLGVMQAERLALSLGLPDVAAIYTSPLSRAVATAQVLATIELNETGVEPGQSAWTVPVIEDQDLREIDHGRWSGRHKTDVARDWPELAAQWLAEPAAMRMPDGESLLEVRTRALRFLDRVRHAHPDGKLVVVTHGTVIRLLLAHFLGMAPNSIWTFDIENGSVSIVEDHETPLIMAINEGCHLDGVRSRLDVQVR